MDISEAYLALRKKDINKAYHVYLKIHKEFDNLLIGDKKKAHPHIKKLYDEVRIERNKYKNTGSKE